MDSCVTAAIARETFELALLHVSYGQRTEQRELRAFTEIADFWNVPQRMAVRLDHFRHMGGSALTDERIAVPEAAPFTAVPEAQTGVSAPQIPITYVPFRNATFLSVAVGWAETIGARAVFIGAVAEDSSGYPDCRPEFYRLFQELVKAGTRPETEIQIETPVIHLRKSEIVRRGIALGAPLHLTWSCYQFGDAACGACESCRLRLRAFAEAGTPDPAPVRSQVAAKEVLSAPRNAR